MITSTNVLAEASKASNLEWVDGKIVALIVGTSPGVHYRALFEYKSTGTYVWANIDASLYEIASTVYVNERPIGVQGNLGSDSPNIISILAS